MPLDVSRKTFEEEMMSIVGELSTAKTAHLQNAAVVGTSQSVSSPRVLSRVVTVPILSKTLPLTAVKELEAFERAQYYTSHSSLFHQGERPGGVFILKSGTVKLSISSSKGRVVILRIATAGEILGLSSLISGDPCIATAETLEACEVGYVDRDLFLQFLFSNPEAAMTVAFQVSANYKTACRQVSLLGLCRSASERLALFLLNWTTPKSFREAPQAWPGLTHEEISQIAGTTRETVTRTLMDFRKKGWASLASSKLVIQDREAMEKLVA